MRAIDQDDVKMARAGITMKNVTVRGTGSALNLQKNVGSVLMAPLRFSENFSFGKKSSKTIIRDFDILMKNGEMLIVLGRPGSGCSTLLKTMTGEMHGLQVDEQSVVHYNGITQQQMMKEFKGEVVYNQEVDKHFPSAENAHWRQEESFSQSILQSSGEEEGDEEASSLSLWLSQLKRLCVV